MRLAGLVRAAPRRRTPLGAAGAAAAPRCRHSHHPPPHRATRVLTTAAVEPAVEPEGGVEARVVAALKGLGASYTLERCDSALSDTRRWCEAYGHTVSSSTSCIVVASKREPKEYAACLVMADRRVCVNKKARALMQLSKKNRPSFASAEETTTLTGMLPGGVCPFGLPADLPLFVDSRVLEAGEAWAATPELPPLIWTGGGSRTLKVGVAPEVMARLPGVLIVEGLSLAPPGSG